MVAGSIADDKSVNWVALPRQTVSVKKLAKGAMPDMLMLILSDAEQLLLLATITVYTPPVDTCMAGFVAPLLHDQEATPMAPCCKPIELPEHRVESSGPKLMLLAKLSTAMENVSLIAQPDESVTTISYWPAVLTLIELEVDPVDQRYV